MSDRVRLAAISVVAWTVSSAATAAGVKDATIADLQRALETRRVTSRDLVRDSLVRIALYEDKLNATLAVNRKALDEADARDRERAAGKARGPIHGIPIALKDNIHTTDMPTTGGALAFDGYVPPYEATLATHLREAGAIIVAKTTLTELANWVAEGMPAQYSALGGQAFIVPFAMVPNAPTPPFPAGFDARPGPFGVSFTGTACSEPRLIAIAYAFEQATRRRVPPASAP